MAATFLPDIHFCPVSLAANTPFRLRERIYNIVMPQLAQGLANARNLKKATAKDLAETYQMAMTVLFRMLFIAYAEDKNLLPCRLNGLYEQHSLKRMARQLADRYPHGLPTDQTPFDDGDTCWQEVSILFQAVRMGKPEWGVPEYGGGLFSIDAEESPAGALLEKVTLPDSVMGAALWHLLVIDTPDGCWRPMDFRSLNVREFGTIYEGLLESELSVADVDLTSDREGYYRPCRQGETPTVTKGRIYIHNRSGARKATGTYFTREFVVEHLLDHALEPALQNHLGRLHALDETDAAERFFDFCVADIAMGSGHFLVAATDRIERAFSGYLATRSLPGVHQELARLHEAAVEQLGELAHQREIEDTQLLRRLIALRCIYGVDLNPMAVHLARLSMWIHTFVPGLPLAHLDRNLVQGNSLVSVAFPEVFVRDRRGFDVILGNPPWQEATVEEHAFWARHEPGLRGLNQREQEKLKERLRAERPDLVRLYDEEVAEAATLRTALTAGPYPGMGTGDPDLYKAFCWRFWHLLCPNGGWLGVVLPRSALNAKGSTEFRLALFQGGCPVDLTILVNNRQWVFPEVHPQYAIGLLCVRRSKPEGKSVRLSGPYNCLDSFVRGRGGHSEFAATEVMNWSDVASLPMLPAEGSLDVFALLRKAPRLDVNEASSWRARPYTELHATNDKDLMDLESEDAPTGHWPVFKGESFDLWEADTGRYYAWADPVRVLSFLQTKRLRGGTNKKSPFSEFESSWWRNPATLPPTVARLAFRDVARATDSRTVRVALVPPRVFLTNQAPFFLWPRGSEEDQAYLLGILSSLPLDWYARRFAETHISFFVINPFPIPRPARQSHWRKRVISLAGRLAACDDRFADWAAAVGVACGPLPEPQKQDCIHELDAVVAHLYGLEEKHLIHIFETFHEGWGYGDRLRETLKHYRRSRHRDG